MAQQPAAGRARSTAAGVAAGLVASALGGLALLGLGALGGGIFAVQVVLALAWLAALDTEGGVGAFAIIVIAAAVADSVIAASSSPDVGLAAGVIGVAFSVSLLHQLFRRPRTGVTMSVAATMGGVAFAVCAASYVALRVESGGDAADTAALLGAGVALAVARLVDVAVARPVAAPGSRRGLVGIVAGLGVAAVAGIACEHRRAVLSDHHIGLRLAVVAALIALIADVAVDVVLTAAPPADARARSAVPPVGVLLPVVLAGPAAYVAGRILLG